MNEVPGARMTLYPPSALEGVLDRMAQQAASLLRGAKRVVVVGVLRRGGPLADRLVERLVRDHGLPAPERVDLKVKRYADDLTLLHPETRLTEEPRVASLAIEGATLLVVDDVLYTGHSALKVVEYLVRARPAALFLAVLADRHATVLPVRADVVGLRLEVAPGDVVECHVPPYEPDFRVELLRPSTRVAAR
jgi:pyrimidine operon attenuation protein/uracil phosphoribosyltransferase